MIKTNVDRLVEVSVMGEIAQPAIWDYPARQVGYDGEAYIPVGYSGITYNVKVGDPAFGWAWGDHVEPGVSIRHPDVKGNSGLNTLACVGNDAVIVCAAMDGKDLKIKGAVGVVTGKHGGAERVLVYFPKRVLERLAVGDKIQIRAVGVGMNFGDYPDIHVMNCSPRLIKAIHPTEKGGKVRIQVSKIVPGKLMGSGLGSSNPHTGDYDIQSVSPEAVKEYDLESIRLGDMVAITDHDATHGPRFHERAVTIGVVVHGSSKLAGHGPGVCVLFTSATGNIEPIITRKANLAELLALT